LEGIRAETGGGGSTAGSAAYFQGENINPDLGSGCPYNGTFYTDDSTNWYGFRVLPPDAVYKRSSVWSSNGDLDVEKIMAITGMPPRTMQWNADVNSWQDIKTIFRLREGVERFFITDINNPAASAKGSSDIPVLFDGWAGSYMADEVGGNNNHVQQPATFNHLPGGSNVLYLDGHVKYIRYVETTAAGQRGEHPVTNGLYGYGREFTDDLSWGLLGKG
jgi:prepilin-type processing-associated H-X9-DG protein